VCFAVLRGLRALRVRRGGFVSGRRSVRNHDRFGNDFTGKRLRDGMRFPHQELIPDQPSTASRLLHSAEAYPLSSARVKQALPEPSVRRDAPAIPTARDRAESRAIRRGGRLPRPATPKGTGTRINVEDAPWRADERGYGTYGPSDPPRRTGRQRIGVRAYGQWMPSKGPAKRCPAAAFGLLRRAYPPAADGRAVPGVRDPSLAAFRGAG